MRARRRIAIAAVVAVAAAGFAFLAPSQAATPVVFFSGDLLVNNPSNIAVKAHNSTAHAISVTATVFQLTGTQNTGSPSSFTVPAHQTHIFNFAVSGIGNCECTVRIRGASGGIIPSMIYVPAGTSAQVNVPAGGFQKRSSTKQTFFSGDVLADHASNFAVKAHNSTSGTITASVSVFQLDGSLVSGTPTAFSIPAHNTHIFNIVVPGGAVLGNCECTAKIHANKPGIIPSLLFVPAGTSSQEQVPAGDWQ